MNTDNQARTQLIRTIERIALVSRYAAYVVLVPLFTAWEEFVPVKLAIITLALLAHNGFAHWVLWTRKYHLFTSVVNFLIYLSEAALIVALTGADRSEGYIIFLLLVIGYGCYAGELRSTLYVTLVCALVYGLVVLIEGLIWGISQTPGQIAAPFVGLGICGLLMGSLGARLRALEFQAIARAQELASSEATLRTILNSAADPIIVYDDREFITEANDPACRLLGLPRGELMGQRIRKYIFDDGTLTHKMSMLRTTGQNSGREVILDASGAEHTVDVTVRSFIREGKRYFVSIGRDVTDQVSLQEASRVAALQLEQLNTELRELDRLRTEFLATMSRRLRSPMGAIIGYVEMLLAEELGEVSAEQRKALQTCRRSALRLLRLVDDALELSARPVADERNAPQAKPRPTASGSPQNAPDQGST